LYSVDADCACRMVPTYVCEPENDAEVRPSCLCDWSGCGRLRCE